MSNPPLRWSARSENMKRFVLVTCAMFFALVVSLVFPVLSAAQSTTTVSVPCNQFFAACGPIPENVPVTFPRGFLAISGDVALLPSAQSDLHAVSDVFHLDNNLLDTGLGTGLGNAGFLFSGHFGTLPDPSTYSANAVGFRENPEGRGDTQYLGNGTDYFPRDRGAPLSQFLLREHLPLSSNYVSAATVLLLTQCNDGIDQHGAPCWKVTGTKRNNQ